MQRQTDSLTASGADSRVVYFEDIMVTLAQLLRVHQLRSQDVLTVPGLVPHTRPPGLSPNGHEAILSKPRMIKITRLSFGVDSLGFEKTSNSSSTAECSRNLHQIVVSEYSCAIDKRSKAESRHSLERLSPSFSLVKTSNLSKPLC